MAETEPGFFHQRNPKSDEPEEVLVTLGEGSVFTFEGQEYKVTRGVQVHANVVLKPAVDEMLPVDKPRSRR